MYPNSPNQLSNFSCLLESFWAVQYCGFWSLAASVSLFTSYWIIGASLVAQMVSVYNVRGLGLNPGLRRSSGRGNGNPLQYSRLENPVNGGAWKAPLGHEELDMTERLQFSY